MLFPLIAGALAIGNGNAALAQNREREANPDVVTDARMTAPAQKGFVAREKNIEYVFKALSAETEKPIVISAKAKKNSVTGNFDLNNPEEVFNRITRDLGLIWYYDGSVYYVYDASEIKTAVVRFPRRNFNDLMTFLKDNKLYERRYPVRMNMSASTLYVSGPPKYVDIITSIASFLSDTPDEDLNEQIIETIKLRHAFVDDRTFNYRERKIEVKGIATTISQLLDSTEKQKPFTAAAAKKTQENGNENEEGEEGALYGEPAYFDANEVEKEAVKVLPFTGRNSLIIKGTRAQVNMIKDLVTALDEPRKQLELSLWIIDINKDDAQDLGVDWKGNVSLGGSVQTLFNTSSILNSAQETFFLAKILALSKDQKANIVSRPILLAQENMPALFDNNRSFYVKLTGEREVALQSVTYGTSVNVTPMISDDSRMVEMNLEITDGSRATDGSGTVEMVDQLPVINQTTISTIARVNEGQSLLIGGYTRDQVQIKNTKIPLLGDIPMLGNIFKSTSNSISKTVRLFLIQPRVLKDGFNNDSDYQHYINDGWDATKRYMNSDKKINREALIAP